jgi:hypothetical protein
MENDDWKIWFSIRVRSPKPAQAGMPVLLRACVIQGHSIICFAGEDWWYHHPHSKYHLMRRFAQAGNRVIFVNSISMGLPSLANKDLFPRIARKLRSYARLARPTPEGVTVVSPAVIPFFGSRASRESQTTCLANRTTGAARRSYAPNSLDRNSHGGRHDW